MANTEVGSAYLTIMPSMKGFATSLNSGVTSAMGKVGSTITSGFATAAKAAAGVATAAVAGVATLTTESVNAYATYEQLVGGVETLFGAGGASLKEYAKQEGKAVSEVKSEYESLQAAQDTVLANAADAYQTAGMSANDYMDTVTSFSASLIQSLDGDTEAAADAANAAVIAMADNANKMGTDMESINNAYQGFAKQNYTMLDNLKLGYGGTKSEMERLIADANELAVANGEAGDLSIDSFADVCEAIELVQDDIGITGTTAEEAANTIEGSCNSMKAAWENWLTGLGDSEADMSELTTELVESIETALDNVVPVAAEVIDTLGELLVTEFPGAITTLADNMGQYRETVTESFSGLFTALGDVFSQSPEILQSLLAGMQDMLISLAASLESGEGGEGLIDTFADLLLQMVGVVEEYTPDMLEAILTLISELGQWLWENGDPIFEAVGELIGELILKILEYSPQLISAALTLIVLIASAIAAAIGTILSPITSAVASIPGVIAQGASDIWASVTDLASGAAQKAGKAASEFGDAASEWISEMAGKLAKGAGDIKDGVVKAFQSAVAYVQGLAGDAYDWGSDIIDSIASGISDAWDSVVGAVTDVAQSIADLIGFSEPKTGPLSDFHTYMPDMIGLMVEGINAGLYRVRDAASGIAAGLAGTLDASATYDYAFATAGTGGTTIYVDGIQATPNSALYSLLGDVVAETQITQRRRRIS